MHHATAEDLDPPGSFAHTAAFAMAGRAGGIYLCAWLCKGKIARTKAGLCIRPKKALGKIIQQPFQMAKMNALIHDQPLYLVENWRMSGINVVAAEYATRADHFDGRLLAQHRTCLYRACMRTKNDVVVDIKSILFIASRMVLRDIQPVSYTHLDEGPRRRAACAGRRI